MKQSNISRVGKAGLAKLDNLPSKVRSHLKKEIGRVSDAASAHIMGYWDFGDWVQQVLKDPAAWGFKKKEDNPLDEMAGVLYARSTLNQILHFRNTYGKRQVNALCKLRMPTGKCLTWGHVIHLLSVDDPKAREKKQVEVVKDNLDPDELKERIQKMYGGKRSAGGRPLTVPKSLNAGLNQMSNMSRQWLDREKKVWTSSKFNMFKQIDELEGDEVSKTMARELEKLATQQEEVAAAAAENAKNLHARAAKMRKTLDNGSSKPAKKAAKKPTKKHAVGRGGKKKKPAAKKKSAIDRARAAKRRGRPAAARA